jgi:SAM-dependent methyltransferase
MRRPAPSEVEPGRSLYANDLDRWLLDALHVKPGDTALELAGGIGGLALRLAERVRPGGRVICSDLRPARVAEAGRRAVEAGATDVDVRVLDMLAIELPDRSVDAVLCRWGLMFAIPGERALAEAFRVLRPGGWLAVAVWGDPTCNPWTTLADAAIREAGLDPPDRSAPGQMLSLAHPGRLESLIKRAGFEGVARVEIPIEWTYPSSAAYWDVDVRWAGGVIDAFLSRLSIAEVASIQSRVEEMLEAYASPGRTYRLPGLALAAAGVRSPTAVR